jgi:hypothetical protein
VTVPSNRGARCGLLRRSSPPRPQPRRLRTRSGMRPALAELMRNPLLRNVFRFASLSAPVLMAYSTNYCEQLLGALELQTCDCVKRYSVRFRYSLLRNG